MFQAPRESLVEFSVLHCNAVICLPQWTWAPTWSINSILKKKERETRVWDPSVLELLPPSYDGVAIKSLVFVEAGAHVPVGINTVKYCQNAKMFIFTLWKINLAISSQRTFWEKNQKRYKTVIKEKSFTCWCCDWDVHSGSDHSPGDGTSVQATKPRSLYTPPLRKPYHQNHRAPHEANEDHHGFSREKAFSMMLAWLFNDNDGLCATRILTKLSEQHGHQKWSCTMVKPWRLDTDDEIQRNLMEPASGAPNNQKIKPKMGTKPKQTKIKAWTETWKETKTKSSGKSWSMKLNMNILNI